MSQNPYNVVHSDLIVEQLRVAMASAVAEGDKALASRAFQWAVEEMERTPSEFGESREYLQYAELYLRIAFVSRGFVSFGVHEPTRTVFVRRIGWFKKR